MKKISNEGRQVNFEHLLLLELNKRQCSVRQSFQSRPGADNAVQGVLLGQTMLSKVLLEPDVDTMALRLDDGGSMALLMAITM